MIWDDLFLLPFLAGLGLAVMLPLLGNYLRLRDNGFAALAYSHLSAAGALLATLFAWAPALGGILMTSVFGAAQRGLGRRLGKAQVFPAGLLLGWAISILVTANFPLAERLGHALFDGQLYFASTFEAGMVGIWLVVVVYLLLRWSSRLLLHHLYPDYFRLCGGGDWSVLLGFDLLVALSLSLATLVLGVMAAFALIFIPARIAAKRAGNWRQGVLFSLLISVLSFVAAFAGALYADQPFGPMLVLMLLGFWFVFSQG